MSNKSTGKLSKIINNWILPFLLVLACVWDVNRGLDLSDTGYNLERYYNYLTYDASSMLSKFWSDYIGHLLTRMPGGNTWLGMTIYCTLVIIAIALIAYYFCSMFLNNYVVFVCEIMAIALYWIPAVVLYDSLSFLLLEITIVLLHFALKRDSTKLFLAAGIVMGINTMVRMPNITYIILILWVWLYAWLYKASLKKDSGMPWVVLRTLVCLAGYLTGLGGSVLYSLRYGDLNDYLRTINKLSGGTKVAGYSLSEMAFGPIVYMAQQAKYVVLLGGVVVVGSLLRKNARRTDAVVIFFVAIAIATIMKVAYTGGVFSMEYDEYSSVKGLLAIVYLWGIVVSVINAFLQSTRQEILLTLLYMSILWVTPLGSNNGIYLNIANSFLLFPMICYMTNQFFKKIQKLEAHKKIIEVTAVAKLVAGIMSVIIIFQTMMFGVSFVFNDSDMAKKIEVSDMLRGVITSEKKAEAVTELISFLEDVDYSSLIQYCDAPGLYYLLQTQRGIQSSWPDLPTCTVENLTAQLEGADEMDELPMIILTNDMSDFYRKVFRCEEVEVDENKEAEYYYDDKVSTLMRFMSRNRYRLIYDDRSMFAVYVALGEE